MAKKKKKKRADHYEDKLQINDRFEAVVKVSDIPTPDPEKKEDKPVQKK